jgi:hypothetical protein
MRRGAKSRSRFWQRESAAEQTLVLTKGPFGGTFSARTRYSYKNPDTVTGLRLFLNTISLSGAVRALLKAPFSTEALDLTRRNVPSPPKVTEERQWRAYSRIASPESRLPTPPGSRKTPPVTRGLSDHLWLTLFGISPLQPLGGDLLRTLLSRRQRYLHCRRGQFQSTVHRRP